MNISCCFKLTVNILSFLLLAETAPENHGQMASINIKLFMHDNEFYHHSLTTFNVTCSPINDRKTNIFSTRGPWKDMMANRNRALQERANNHKETGLPSINLMCQSGRVAVDS